MKVGLVLIFQDATIDGKRHFFSRWTSRNPLNGWWAFPQSRQDVPVVVGAVGAEVYNPGLNADRWVTSDVVPGQHAFLIDSSRRLIRNDGLAVGGDGGGDGGGNGIMNNIHYTRMISIIITCCNLI
jgi:hypothetical protein